MSASPARWARTQSTRDDGYGEHRSWGIARNRRGGIVETGVVARQRLLGTIARSDQRSGHALQESQLERTVTVLVKLGRSHEPCNVQMIGCGAQILPEGENIDGREIGRASC